MSSIVRAYPWSSQNRDRLTVGALTAGVSPTPGKGFRHVEQPSEVISEIKSWSNLLFAAQVEGERLNPRALLGDGGCIDRSSSFSKFWLFERHDDRGVEGNET